MQVHVSIGENHRFELREALLVYRDNQSSFITRHDVTARKDASPTLGPAQPLTVAFIESLVRSLGGGAQAEVLPANILAKADRLIVWWTPAGRRQMFYENSEGKAAKFNGRFFPQPPLVWRVSNGEINIRQPVMGGGGAEANVIGIGDAAGERQVIAVSQSIRPVLGRDQKIRSPTRPFEPAFMAKRFNDVVGRFGSRAEHRNDLRSRGLPLAALAEGKHDPTFLR